MRRIRLENWSTAFLGDEYTAPELQRVVLQGESFGDWRREDGHFVHTTPIIGIVDGLVKTSSGSLYELGAVDPEFEKLYPDAKSRLIQSLHPTTMPQPKNEGGSR